MDYPLNHNNIGTWIASFDEKITDDDLRALGEDDRTVVREYVARWLDAYTGTFEFVIDMQAAHRAGQMSLPKYRGVLNCIRAEFARSARDAALADPPTPGTYHKGTDGDLYRVQATKFGDGFYCKRLVVHSPHSASWEYEGRGPIFDGIVSAETELSVDELAALSLEAGMCLHCAAELTAPESLIVGFGPTCTKKLTGQTQIQRIKQAGKYGELLERRNQIKIAHELAAEAA